MPWTLKLHAERPDNPQAGDLWFAPWLVGRNDPNHWLSKNYMNDWQGKRLPLVVRLPGGVDFGIDGPEYSHGKPFGDGWKVTGDPPKLTLTPSINISGTYHGHICDGVLSEDVEGRKF